MFTETLVAELGFLELALMDVVEKYVLLETSVNVSHRQNMAINVARKNRERSHD